MCISVNANPPISYVIKVFTQVICSRDPGLVFPDPGFPALISESLVKISCVKNTIKIFVSIGPKFLQILWPQIRLDLGSEIRDPGWIEISPDPQHYLALTARQGSLATVEDTYLFMSCLLPLFTPSILKYIPS
jgi:hypothetical protein